MKTFFSFLMCMAFLGWLCCMGQGTWIQKADYEGGFRNQAVGLQIGDNGYIAFGVNDTAAPKDIWEYNPQLNYWTQKADMPTEFGRESAVAFSIGMYGYVGTGKNSLDELDDLWRYDPSTNTWEKKADFGGGDRNWAVGIRIGDKVYIGTGSNGALKKDWWEYDPATNAWTQKSDLPASPRHQAVAFSIGNKGYLGLGTLKLSPTHPQDFWEFDPATNFWTQRADFAGTIWSSAVAFSIGGKGYVGTGIDTFGVITNQFWQYDPVADTWSKMPDFPGAPRRYAAGFAIGSHGYIGTGKDDITDSLFKDFWQFTPGCAAATGLAATNIIQSKVTLQWNSVDGAAGYKLRYKVKNTNNWTVLATPDNLKKISGLSASNTYVWQVKTICSTAPIVASEWSAKEEFTTSLRLGTFNEPLHSLSVYPNPVHKEAIIRLFIAENSAVSLEIFDLSGIKIQALLVTNLEAGNHEVLLRRNQLTSGIYLLRLTTGEKTEVMKIVIE